MTIGRFDPQKSLYWRPTPIRVVRPMVESALLSNLPMVESIYYPSNRVVSRPVRSTRGGDLGPDRQAYSVSPHHLLPLICLVKHHTLMVVFIGSTNLRKGNCVPPGQFNHLSR